MTNLEISIQYANDCISDVIPSCVYVKKAAQRFLNDLNDLTYFYCADDVDAVINFINLLDLSEQTQPKKFILEPWQTFIISNLYGIKRKDTNRRKYKYAYIELARKNGKSQLVTALAIYHLLTDNDAQIVVSANSREQAKNVDFKKIKQYCSQLDPKQRHLIHYYNSIKFGTSELIVTASDSSKLDGLSSNFSIIDELHSAPDNSMYNVIKSSQGARSEPLFLAITTAGFDTESFCYQLRTYITDILFQQKEDEAQFGIIYTLDSEDDYTSKNNWIKSNPNLGISLIPEFLESEVIKAENNESEKNGVLVKNFNQWLKNNTLDTWIDDKFFADALKPLDINNFKGDECWVGIDLASVSDVTAVSYLYNSDGQLYFFNRYFIPEDSINSNINREIFKEAGQLGYINVTSGNVCDYNLILNELKKQNQLTPISTIYYDKFNSTQFVIDATELFTMEPFSQMPGSLNQPLKEFERLIKSGRITIERNSITRWMLNNVVLNINSMGNYSIDKKSRNKKIDGVASMMNALGGFLRERPLGVNVW